MLQTVCSCVCALIVSFVTSWKLSLVIGLALPFMTCAIYINLRVSAGQTLKNKVKLENSLSVVLQSLANIHTVKGLGIENMLFHNFCEILHKNFR